MQMLTAGGCSAAARDVSVRNIEDMHLGVAWACVLAWLRVAGAESVLPPWVRHSYPQTSGWIHALRDVPCERPDCSYCRTTHNPQLQLNNYFCFDDFRPIPQTAEGKSLQAAVVQSGMQDQPHLAILPTGGGKSLCFQLPALVRNFRRGSLTIVISPLQALMKDQVDGLVRRTNTTRAAALYGMLTMPERGDVLKRITSGEVALLYISPEQLRNASLQKAIKQREIGGWVFDEAHCLSKWGHDFRSDYLYAGRFIREFSAKQNQSIAPISCFTATAKQDVTEEILAFFKEQCDQELILFEGGVERDNLRFEVQIIGQGEKLERFDFLLGANLPDEKSGAAVIFRATRADTEKTADYLAAKGWKVAHFHAGLRAPQKKEIQNAFLGGEIQVICATNAFGMGIDKDDVRLVIHGDTPGSLENYLQEAGRAGRDRAPAQCVLLYDENDCERQFQLGALSELSRRDIAQILRGLRKASRGHTDEVIITSGELLRDEDVETEFDLDDKMADTKVRTAVSWLERAGFVQRNDNATSVFQARVVVKDIGEARGIMEKLKLSASEQLLWEAILRELMNAAPTEMLSVDQLALLPEFLNYAEEDASEAENVVRESQPRYAFRRSHEYVSSKILRVLKSMDEAQVLRRDTLLSAFVRYKVVGNSPVRLDKILALDRRMLEMLQEHEPDPEGQLILSLRLLNQRLMDEGFDSTQEIVRELLRSLEQDGTGFGGASGSLEITPRNRDVYWVWVRRPWDKTVLLAEKRRRIADVLLKTIMAKIPSEQSPRADLQVHFSFEELESALNIDLELRQDITDMHAAIERGLMYLHEQQVIILQGGLSIFRQAMRISVNQDMKGQRYSNPFYEPLQHHYHERIFQVHVMNEYARKGLEKIQEALTLVAAYFAMDKATFITRFLGGRTEMLDRATTARTFEKMVTDLRNPEQIAVVTAPRNKNMLILAGPGSGKTRCVVHRCAYLLKIERVAPRRILLCCYNRSAAVEMRRRLLELAGPQARNVTVATYHGLAMRLLGRSFRDQSGDMPNFEQLIADATALLRGESEQTDLQADDVRERLLSGYEFILVDEYQDIDQAQYDLISALAGRTEADPDRKLAILAVGDDDQNIYTFRGANTQFIRQFKEDYRANTFHLTANYRATAYLIAASNAVIAANSDRMKVGREIHIDQDRQLNPPGGLFGQQDKIGRGKVLMHRLDQKNDLVQVVLDELYRLRKLGVEESQIAILSRNHRELNLIRGAAEANERPINWSIELENYPPLHRTREIHSFILQLKERPRSIIRINTLIKLAESVPDNTWGRLLKSMLTDFEDERGNSECAIEEVIDYIYEACADMHRSRLNSEGVVLSTIHHAKGTEYDHVLLIPDRRPPSIRKREDERRLLYVGMTRARQTLSVFFPAKHPFLQEFHGSAFKELTPDPAACPLPDESAYEYATLGLNALNIGYAGHFSPEHPIHSALSNLRCGDELHIEPTPDSKILLVNSENRTVACLSNKTANQWDGNFDAVSSITVRAIIHRYATDGIDPSFQSRYKTQSWELPICEIRSSP